MNLWVKMRITRVTRLKAYLSRLEGRVKVTNKTDKENIEFLKQKMRRYLGRMAVFAGARTFFYILLYISVVLNFLGDLAEPQATAFIDKFASPLVVLSSIIGTTISLIYVLLFTKFVNIYWEDIRTISTNMISIYSKYDTKKGGIVEPDELE